jgi:hypothetical protein
MHTLRYAIVLILLLSASVWAAPNSGSGVASRSGGGGSALAAVDASISLIPSVTSGEAPLAVGLTVRISGTSLGKASWFYIVCNDDTGNILPNTGIVTLQSENAYTSTYEADGFCIYESAGSKTARLWYTYRGSLNFTDASIEVTESIGSIDVQLGVTPLTSTETTDFTMVGTVTGEDGNDTVCKFWHDCTNGCTCDAAGIKYDESGTCGADDSGDVAAPGAGAADTGVATYSGHTVVTDGEYTAAVACQRNAQEDTAYVPYTVLPDVIAIESFTADPTTGADPLSGVELEATVSTSCLSTSNITFQFDCLNDTVFEHSSGALAIEDYMDEGGVVTYNTQTDGAFDCANFTPANTYAAALKVDCENATQATATTSVVVKAGTTFSFDASTVPSSGTEPLSNVVVWVHNWDSSGTAATGDITVDAVDCDTGAGDVEGTNYFSNGGVGYNIGDLSGPYNLLTSRLHPE